MINLFIKELNLILVVIKYYKRIYLINFFDFNYKRINIRNNEELDLIRFFSLIFNFSYLIFISILTTLRNKMV